MNATAANPVTSGCERLKRLEEACCRRLALDRERVVVKRREDQVRVRVDLHGDRADVSPISPASRSFRLEAVGAGHSSVCNLALFWRDDCTFPMNPDDWSTGVWL